MYTKQRHWELLSIFINNWFRELCKVFYKPYIWFNPKNHTNIVKKFENTYRVFFKFRAQAYLIRFWKSMQVPLSIKVNQIKNVKKFIQNFTPWIFNGNVVGSVVDVAGGGQG